MACHCGTEMDLLRSEVSFGEYFTKSNPLNINVFITNLFLNE